jgi:hypothetical protein
MEEKKKPDEEKIPRRPEPVSESVPGFLSGDKKRSEEKPGYFSSPDTGKKPEPSPVSHFDKQQKETVPVEPKSVEHREEKPVVKPIVAPVQQESPPETKKAQDSIQVAQPAVDKEKVKEKKIKEAHPSHKVAPAETPKIEAGKAEEKKVTEKPKKIYSRKPIIFTLVVLVAAAAIFLLWPGISKIFIPQRKTQTTAPLITAVPGPAEQLVDIGIPVLAGAQAFAKNEADGLDSISFVCDMTPEDVVLYYIRQLGTAGWGIVSRQGKAGDAEQVVVFRKDKKEYVLMAVKRQDGQTSAWFTLPQ